MNHQDCSHTSPSLTYGLRFCTDHVFHPEGVSHTSPLGKDRKMFSPEGAKYNRPGKNNGFFKISKLNMMIFGKCENRIKNGRIISHPFRVHGFLYSIPGALPRADISDPFGVKENKILIFARWGFANPCGTNGFWNCIPHSKLLPLVATVSVVAFKRTLLRPVKSSGPNIPRSLSS